MATDRTFVFQANQQNLLGDAIIELFAIDLFSGVQKIPDQPNQGLDWENSSATCYPVAIELWDMSDIVNSASPPLSICTDAPNYDDPAFAAGTADWDDADIAPRNLITQNQFVGGFALFCNWQETNGSSVLFGGNFYVPLPYEKSGFAISNEGVLPNPTITVSNVGLGPTTQINAFDDLLGAKVIRRRVLAKHLDNGSQPDVNARWPDETWFVQRKVAENKLFVTFELSTPFDLDGVTLPKRRALRYACPWVYRSTECGYTGGPVANAKDQPVTDATEDQCGKRVSSCRLRYTGSQTLPYGGFPGLTLD